MTIPHERYRAIKQSRKFLEELCDPGRTPRVPGAVRDKARTLLRHYPGDWELDQITEKAPDLLDNKSVSDKIYNT
jgi:hypothetical protein